MELHQPVFSQDQHNYERIVLWINRKFLEDMGTPVVDFARCFRTAAQEHTNLLRPDSALRQTLTYEMESMLQEMEKQDVYSEVNALTYLAQILIQLNRHAEQAYLAPEPKEASNVVYRILHYINEHYNEDLSLDYLANKFFLSKFHLSREFNRLIGTSVHRYIIQKRLAMAKQMMADGMSSSDVYQHCGFGDYSTFYRAFKSEYQVSPKEFVARLKVPAVRQGELRRFIREV
jgi:AraC-like DNA-binding protein